MAALLSVTETQREHGLALALTSMPGVTWALSPALTTPHPVADLPARLSMISLFMSVPVSLSCHLLRGHDSAVHFCIPTVHGI